MKVALLVPGGVDRSGEYRVIPCLLALIERLASHHEVHVFALRQEPGPVQYLLLGARVHVIGRRPHRIGMARAVLAEHRRGRFDLLHAVWAVPSGVVAGWVSRVAGIPVLLHVTGADLAALPEIGYGTERTWRGRRGFRFAVRRASRITTPSAAMKRTAAAMGVESERLPFGVDLDRWPPRPPRRCEPNQPARLLQVASLNPVKDQATLLAAARRLRDAGRAFTLDVVGEDTMGGRIQAMCRDLGLADITTFHGFLPHRELRPLVERSHLLVVSSRHEADPVVMLEAAVSGVPTVSTAVGHALDFAPVAAVSVPVGDSAKLAEGVARLIDDEDVRLNLAAEAQRRTVSEDADWTARRVMELFEGLVRAEDLDAPYRRWPRP